MEKCSCEHGKDQKIIMEKFYEYVNFVNELQVDLMKCQVLKKQENRKNEKETD